MLRSILVFMTIAFLSVSCATANKAEMGAAGGAAGGALLGQIIGKDTGGTLLGAAIGGVLGYMIGNEMDKYDRQHLNKAYENTPSYTTSNWVNPDTGSSYAVTPEPAYENAAAQVCRKAEIEAVIDGKKQITEATACRENGRWVLQQ